MFSNYICEGSTLYGQIPHRAGDKDVKAMHFAATKGNRPSINLESVPRPAKTLQPAKKAMELDHVENDSENKDAVPTGGNGESMQ